MREDRGTSVASTRELSLAEWIDVLSDIEADKSCPDFFKKLQRGLGLVLRACLW